MALRNNISQHYPRAAKLQLVRWREIDGVPQTQILARAHQRWPDLPKIHNSTWRSWAPTAEYIGIRSLVCEEQAGREQMADLFQAAGGDDALSDIAMAGSYALAQRALSLAASAEDAADIQKLMAAIKGANAVGQAQLKEQHATEIAAIEHEHAMAIAEREADLQAMQEDLTAAHAEADRLQAICERSGLDTSGTTKGELSEAARKRIRRIYGME